MRITGGAARGINLDTGRRDDVRPATDMMRQAVFSSLAALVPGRTCLDLFAGTGAYGLEALSRGAESVLFIEADRRAVAAIWRNIAAVCKSMGANPAACSVQQRDVFSMREESGAYGMIFVDPPYAMLPLKAGAIFDIAVRLLAPDGLLVFEMPGGLELGDARMDTIKRLAKGKNDPSVCVFTPKGKNAQS